MNPIPLPQNFRPPSQWRLQKILLEVLVPTHNKLDYEAWRSSQSELRGIFGPEDSWPDSVKSPEQNQQDLEMHFQQFKRLEAFTYTLLNLQRSQCLGCLYIRPTPLRDFQCRVDFWFRNSARHFEGVFFPDLKNWLTDTWKLERIAYPGRTLPWETYQSLQT